MAETTIDIASSDGTATHATGASSGTPVVSPHPQTTITPPAVPAGTTIDDLLKPTGNTNDPDFVHLGNLRVEKNHFDDFAAAQKYLSKDPEAMNVLYALEHAPDQRTIHFIANGQDGYMPQPSFDAQGHLQSSPGTIDWDPKAALQVTNGTTVSPALALLHEEGHAYQHATNAQGYLLGVRDHNKRFDTAEEQRNILGLEDRAARILGEGVRGDHTGFTYPVNGPTSRNSIEPHRAYTPDQLRPHIENNIFNLQAHGYPVPPSPSNDANAIKPWDGKEHTGTFIQIDSHTAVQHVGRGQYQVFDVDRDLHGQMPTQLHSIEVDAKGVLHYPLQQPTQTR
ncbi:MAG: hypothetical protein JO103_14550 [Candidatus Eremiobacteraeota bacterium]|nr:hypothetical protein [Candidatus Eremiobacteraeota bacterium]MBV9408393.1 hypothetical protein [Candidatus Eremiobacteraeota bacterium]